VYKIKSDDTLNQAKLCCKTDSKNSWLLGVGQVQNSEMREKRRVREKGIERDRESARNSETQSSRATVIQRAQDDRKR